MRIFSFGNDDEEELPEGLRKLLKSITELIANFEGDDLDGEPFDEETTADHKRVAHLATYMDELDDEHRNTDGNKLRYLSMRKYRKALEEGKCVHDCEVADDLLGMADRLDELDLKESEIST